MDWEGGQEGGDEAYEHGELKYEGDEVYEHGELKYEGDKVYEHEGCVNGPEYGDVGECEVYEHERLEHGNYGVHEPEELDHQTQEPEYKLNHEPRHREMDNGIRAPHTAFANRHDEDNNVHASTRAYALIC
jgi:hypothetical protein